MNKDAVQASVPSEEYGVNHTQTGNNYSWYRKQQLDSVLKSNTNEWVEHPSIPPGAKTR